jgi:glycosyltransferase involved in cell wall biosynthesis
MKVVMAPVNISGQPITLVKELRRIGLDVSLVQYTGRGTGHRLGYESDRIVQYTGGDRDRVQLDTIEALLREGTTIFHFWLRSLFFSGVYEGFTGLDIPIIRGYGRNIVYRFTGEDLRIRSLHIERNPHHAYQYGYTTTIDEERQRRYIDFLKENVDRFIVQDPEMHEFCPEATIVPRVVDLNDLPFVGGSKSERPLVVHAPTSPLVKGTRFVREAVAELEREGLAFDYREISGVAHEEAVQIYRRADIIIDQLHLGWYGVLAIEGMALGKAVIVYVRPEFLASHQPKIPIIPANPLNITEVLRTAIKDAELRRELGNAGRRYVEEVHDVRTVAPRLAQIYRDLPEKTMRQPAIYTTLEYFRHQWQHEQDKQAAASRKARAYDRVRRSGQIDLPGEVPLPARARRPSQRVAVPAALAARRLQVGPPPADKQDVVTIAIRDEPVLELERANTVAVAPEAEPASAQPGPGSAGGVVVRRCPWPFKGMLAICNDIDRVTATRFALLHRFLNTRDDTPLGRGLGLDVADSFWFYAPAAPTAAGRNPADRQMAFFAGLDWRRRSADADQILEYIRGGWIDTLHSYGDFSAAPAGQPGAFTRAHAEHALEELAEAGLTIGVWVNHGWRNNTQNIGTADYMLGDTPATASRHSDLLFRQGGVRFFWPGEISAKFCRDTPASPIVLHGERQAWSFARQDFAYRDDAAELSARLGAVTGSHAGRPIAMVWEPKLLHVQLAPENLAQLIAEGGFAILGQHFGAAAPGKEEVLPKDAVEALQRLAAAQDAGDILVARTSRLLEYACMREHVQFSVTRDADPSGATVIDITGIDDPVRGAQPPVLNRIRGITFEVLGEGPVELCLEGRPISRRIPREIVNVQLPGRRIIGIRWFPADYADYASTPVRRGDETGPGAVRTIAAQPPAVAPAAVAAAASRTQRRRSLAWRWIRFCG